MLSQVKDLKCDSYKVSHIFILRGHCKLLQLNIKQLVSRPDSELLILLAEYSNYKWYNQVAKIAENCFFQGQNKQDIYRNELFMFKTSHTCLELDFQMSGSHHHLTTKYTLPLESSYFCQPVLKMDCVHTFKSYIVKKLNNHNS